MPEGQYEEGMAPTPGQTASQRRAFLDKIKFVLVRNLAYMTHRKPGERPGETVPLLTYTQTLDNHETVKNIIIQYEIDRGLLVDDRGTTPPVQSLPQPQPVLRLVAPQAGAQPMPQPPPPFQPQQAAPQFQSPPPQMAPQQMQLPVQNAPPVAPPAVAAAAGEPAPTGRKRRTAGAAVAPPPAAPPPSPAAPIYGAPAAPQAAAPAFQAPLPPQQYTTPPPPPQATMAPPQQASTLPPPQSSFDVLERKLDMLGKGVEIAANNADKTMKMLEVMSAELADTRTVATMALACLHHLYGTPSAFPQAMQGVDTFNKFRTYMAQYIGPTSPK